MEEKYEVILFRPRGDLVRDLFSLFVGEELGIRVRQIGERLNLPNGLKYLNLVGFIAQGPR